MRRVATDSILVTVLNTATHVANFLVYVTIAALFGAGGPTDAFFLAFAIPSFLMGAVVNAVGAVFIPVIAECKLNHPSDLGKLIGSTLGFVMLFALGLAVATGFSTPTIVGIAAGHNPYPGFAALVTLQVLILLPVVVIQVTTGVLSAAYNAMGQFWITPTTDTLGTLLTLLLVALLQNRYGILGVPLAFVGGALAHLGMLCLLWPRTHIRVEWNWKPEPSFRQALYLSLPLALGTAALQFGVVVSRFLAAQLPEGSVTILDYASRLSSGVMEFLTSGVLLVTLADWSNIAAQQDNPELLRRFRQIILTMLLLVLPIVGVLIAIRVPVITLALQRGQFSGDLTAATGGVFLLFLLGIPIDTAGRVYVRLFLVWRKTWLIGSLAVLRLAFALACAVALIGSLGVNGLALADTLGIVFVTVCLAVLAHRRPDFRNTDTAMEILKTIVVAVGGGAAAYLAGWMSPNLPVLIVVVWASSVGAGVSFGLAYMLRIEQFGALSTFAQRILRREKVKV